MDSTGFKTMDIGLINDRLFPITTNEEYPCSDMIFYAQSDITCYILRGKQGDLLIDTGMPQTWIGMRRWLKNFDVRYVLLTHAHADHDWNAAKLQKAGAKLLLCERDRTLRQNYMSQPVKPTLPRYTLRNFSQWINGSIFNSPPYDADIYFSAKERSLLRDMGFDAAMIPLPGHTYGSVGVLCGNVLYCGDAFTGIWKRPDITPHAVSPKLLKKSLERIVRISPEWLACGHGLPMRYKDAYPVIKSYLGMKMQQEHKGG
ncbi:MAG: MBL fold metallo-hydrolase [Oscillospiraceae bacterium]|nr:MBL fold metallo-hydrolase [Oscillospiraceae bacterium]